MEDKQFDENLQNVLVKRALGYTSEEVIEEYTDDNGKLKLIKRKVTKKDIPPDINAVKILLDKSDDEEFDLTNLTDEELLSLKKEVTKQILPIFDNSANLLSEEFLNIHDDLNT